MLPLVMTLQTLGTLKARVVAIDKDPEVKRVVVLLHGYGAPGDDLVALAEALPFEKGTRYVFPEAPIDLGGGRAWWMIDWAERAQFERSGDWRGYTERVPPDLATAENAVNALLDIINDKWKVEDVVLGGFSQGAMLAVDVAARRKRKPHALVCMSGAPVATPRWAAQAASLKGLAVFQSHGTADQTLPFVTGEALRDILKVAGANVEWHAFAGGHGIPHEVLLALRDFLSVSR